MEKAIEFPCLTMRFNNSANDTDLKAWVIKSYCIFQNPSGRLLGNPRNNRMAHSQYTKSIFMIYRK